MQILTKSVRSDNIYISLDLRLDNSMEPVPDIDYWTRFDNRRAHDHPYPDDSGHMEEKSVSF